VERDRESVGLTPSSVAALARIEALGWFGDGQDIARFALAYAIRAGAEEGSSPNTETRWAAGNFDKTGEIRALLGGLYPKCDTPVRQMEFLVNEGLRMMLDKLNGDVSTPDQLMG